MRREFYLFKRNGIYYAEIHGKNGERLSSKSTGKRDRDAAAAVVGQWLKDGVPVGRHDAAPRPIETALSLTSILKAIRITDLTPDDALLIVDALKTRALVFVPVIKAGEGTEPAYDFLRRFWNFDESPYVREKLLHGQSITRRHCRESIRTLERAWKDSFSGQRLAEVTRQQLKTRLLELAEKDLSPHSVNKAYAAISTPLRWAAKNGLIPVDPTVGIMRFSGRSARRGILEPKEIKALFEIDWPDPRGRVAFAVAVTTGARLGEIRSLRLPDIGEDRLFIRHGWNNDDGLKTPKNGEEREVPLLEPVRTALLDIARKSPFGTSDDHFIFYGIQEDQPIAEKYLLRWYKEALKTIGIDEEQRKARNLVFHGLRHVYAKTMADRLDARAVMRTTGHKTSAIFEQYTDHKTEDDLRRVGEAIADAFGKVILFDTAAGGV